MLKTSKTVLIASSIVLFSALIVAADAQSCCPGGGNGSPISTNGFGESAPAAANLSNNPSVRIYQFERNGVTYLQINDATGQVRGAIARVNDIAWVTPMGKDVDEVKTVEKFDKLNGTVVSNTRYFTVQVANGAHGDAWTVTIKK
ncbi:hypothetical protein [Xanthomonas sp. GPE 39]|uniref:hypothetical protein n=1 Tax=Xanthomonas sp. GPE 39 TaxID=1583099 RepID=UPI0005F2FA4F|nr:hypothetical protein [Xanthomonas sp. GPE 39]